MKVATVLTLIWLIFNAATPLTTARRVARTISSSADETESDSPVSMAMATAQRNETLSTISKLFTALSHQVALMTGVPWDGSTANATAQLYTTVAYSDLSPEAKNLFENLLILSLLRPSSLSANQNLEPATTTTEATTTTTTTTTEKIELTTPTPQNGGPMAQMDDAILKFMRLELVAMLKQDEKKAPSPTASADDEPVDTEQVAMATTESPEVSQLAAILKSLLEPATVKEVTMTTTTTTTTSTTTPSTEDENEDTTPQSSEADSIEKLKTVVIALLLAKNASREAPDVPDSTEPVLTTPLANGEEESDESETTIVPTGSVEVAPTTIDRLRELLTIFLNGKKTDAQPTTTEAVSK